ncbi:SusC/RagA family TonB-linked outer membrane protein [Flavobacterium orientale]|uniref:SusC/RagA family TonB-linked outer membrane protein n=1 Tax=Flavobacterium orientale TaxID=1756020 RepID=A0A916XZ82_9FLAO|nr:TonB-dependent receptor [Flavobacterium orientale]GGD23705.1 SusC/RagA family TonB-linked outer membrane protein [Flavobacterium orientale]
MKVKLVLTNSIRIASLLFVFSIFFSAASVVAQNVVEISGTVVDSGDKISIPGVNIIEKGTSNGVSTDFDGAFSFKVKSANSIIVVSYIGYKTQEIELKGRTKLTIELVEDQQALEEVVLVGYGSVRKKDLTGAVSVLSGQDIERQPIANVGEALTGRLAGVQVTSSEGSPDSDINIRIRGGGSLTQDASPLLIVDGFPVNSINEIAPSDIENVTVLKDASSTAIYGARGAYGVILITTKSGKSGEKVSVTYNMFTGFKRIANTIDVLKPADFAKWQYEYALLEDDLPSYEDFFGSYSEIGQYDNAPNTNWQKEIYGRNGAVESHNIGIRGGSEKLNYNFNFVRFTDQTIMVGSNFRRDNISMNLKNKVNEKIELNFTFRYSNSVIKGGGANEQREFSSSADARLRHSIGYSPIPIPGLTDDDTDEAVAGYLVNPFLAVADNDRLQERRNYNMLGGITYKITKELQFRSDVGLDYFKNDDYRFYGRSTFYVRNIPAAENQGLPSLLMSNRNDNRFRNANTLNYDFKKILSPDHKLKLLLGQETIIYKSNNLQTVIHGYPDFFTFNNAINLTTLGTPQSVNNFNNPEDNLMSFFGRVNYDLKDKYLFTATFRADGSSKFLGDNKWGYFPSAAVAWKINEENFLKDVSWLDALKIRFSYGQAGNNNIPTGQTIQNFLSTNSTWISGVDNFWAPSNVLANPDLKWETMISQNLGLDFELYDRRISGSFELYKNITKDLLINFLIPGSGYNSQFRNMGETQNMGLEASLNLDAIRKENYGLSFGFNIGMNKNRINSTGTLGDFGVPTNWASTAIGNDFAVQVGQPIGLMLGYRNDGRYEVSDFDYNDGVYTLKPEVANASTIVGPVRPGSMKLKDLNGDGVVNGEDVTVIGNANPTSTGGFTINANAYNFDLSAAFNWSYGNDIYNAGKIEHNTATITSPDGQYRNLTTTMADGNRWTNLDPVSGQLVTDPTALAALNATTSLWSPYMPRYVMTDWAVEDGSFLRLNTLTLGYSLPESIISKTKISRLRIYATANNVFILTNYSGLDPEVSTRRASPLTPGVDYSPYPRNRQFVLGLNVNF